MPNHISQKRELKTDASMLRFDFSTILANLGLPPTTRSLGSILFCAVRKKRLDIVKCLLTEVCEQISAEEKGIALEEAASLGYLKIIKVLLNKSGEEILEHSKNTAFEHACQKGFSQILLLLITHHSGQTFSAMHKGFVLYYALLNRQLEVVELLLNRDTSILPSQYKGLILCHAAEYGEIKIATLLLKMLHHYNQPIPEAYIGQIFCYAFQRKELKIIKLLIEHPTWKTVPKHYKGWVLQEAVKYGFLEVVTLLLHYNGREISAHYKNVAFEHAKELNSIDIIISLTTHPLGEIAKNHKTWVLQKFSKEKDFKQEKWLLQKFAEQSSTATDKGWVFYYATCNGYLDIVKSLLSSEEEICPNFINQAFRALLEKGFSEIMFFILTHQRGQALSREHKEWALTQTALAKHLSMKKKLLQSFAEQATSSEEKAWVLRYASYEGELDIVKFLFTPKGQALSIEDGALALQRAIYGKHLAIVMFLLTEEPSLQMLSTEVKGQALVLATHIGNLNIAQFLITQLNGQEKAEEYTKIALYESKKNGQWAIEKLLYEHLRQEKSLKEPSNKRPLEEGSSSNCTKLRRS